MSEINISHGSGGSSTWRLIDQLFRPAFYDPALSAGEMGDGTVLTWAEDLTAAGCSLDRIDPARIVLATDSHVVSPIFFPGGNTGSLSVNGTVNDLAVMGAIPLYLTAGFILEEGLKLEDLRLIVEAMATAARIAGVRVVTGDTKVVERGKGDGLYINTAGFGMLRNDPPAGAARVQPGDRIIINGSIGDHGAAIMAARMELHSRMERDCASIYPFATAALDEGGVRLLRDPTRGGVAAVLNEFASVIPGSFYLNENQIPVKAEVKGISSLLGFDPLQLACEGRIVGVVSRDRAEAIVAKWRLLPGGAQAAIIGEVVDERSGLVMLETESGGKRIVEMPTGELLPRIC